MEVPKNTMTIEAVASNKPMLNQKGIVNQAYSKEQRNVIMNYIFSQIALNRYPRSIVKDPQCPISRATMYEWLDRYTDDYAYPYVRACKEREEYLIEELGDIADDNTNDFRTLSNGVEIVDNDHIQRTKLRYDHRKFLLEISDPYKYGKRTTIAGDANAPLLPQLNEAQVNERLVEKLEELKKLGMNLD
jgi:hypothetical protein